MANIEAKGGHVPTYLRTHVTDETDVAPTEHAARAFSIHEVAAIAWQALSEKHPHERGTAAARYRAYAREMDPDLLLAAMCELAVEGYSARAFNRAVARDRIARIREREVDAFKALEGSPLGRAKTLVAFRSVADQLRAAGLPLGIFEAFA